jgi:O-6-methylguanine DNA methyltransferase
MSRNGLWAVEFPKSPSFLKRGKGEFLKSHFGPLFKSGKARKLDLTRHTPFQLKVYATLRKVPVGKTVTYGELARLAGYPGAARAVGTAMKKNRLPIVIPCHRVLPSAGGLGEYSAGKKWKRYLLVLEKLPSNGIRVSRCQSAKS